MSREPKTTRGKKLVEGLPFTAETVAQLLKDTSAETAIAPDKLAALLNDLQQAAIRARHTGPFKKKHKRFTEMLVELHSDIIPALQQQMLTLGSMGAAFAGSDVEHQVAPPQEVMAAVTKLTRLKDAIEKCANTALLTHPETRIAGVDRWQDFAAPIENLLVSAGGSRRAAWRFIVAIVPQLTGEASPSFEAVEIFLKRRRLPLRAHRPL